MIRGVKRVCLGCGVLTSHGSRCQTCKAIQDREIEARRGVRPHYQGDYKQRAKVVRDNATVCYLCGQGARAADPFQADHVIEGDPYSPLLPAHRSCNIRKAQAAKQNAKRT
jgi:hypothetical protein